MVDLAAGVLAGLFVLVLPGLGLRELAQVPIAGAAFELSCSVALSIVLVAAVGLPMVGMGIYAPIVSAVVLGGIGLVGIWRAVRTLAETSTAATAFVGIAVGLTVPIAQTSLHQGWPPAFTFQWFYWELGEQLSQAGGRPEAVLEYGRAVRWLPDYLVFNLQAESYRAMVGFLPEADAMAVWRVVPSVLVVLLAAAVSRLWLSRTAAMFPVVAVVGLAFFTSKFNAFKPEAIGLVVGLAAVHVAAISIRRASPVGLVLAGGTVGLAMAVHAIAAVLSALVLAAVVLVEWSESRQPRRLVVPVLGMLVVGSVVLVAVGWAFQGRVSVAADATRPAVAEDRDLTWEYLAFSEGLFDRPRPPEGMARVPARVKEPVGPVDLESGWWIAAAGVVVLALAGVAAFRPRRQRSGARVLLLVGASLAITIQYFVFAFDTYVPQNTGYSRFMQYVPPLLVACLAFVVVSTLERWPRVLPPLLIVLSLVAFSGVDGNLRTRGLSDAAHEALTFVADRGAEGDVVIANVPTAGLIEHFTGLESPLEGRQPLIEEPAVLRAAVAGLEAVRAYFVDPEDEIPFDARWILVVDDPADLARTASFGASTITDVQRALGREPVFLSSSVAVFESPASQPTADGSIEVERSVPQTAVVVSVLGVLALGVLAHQRRRATMQASSAEAPTARDR